MKVLAKSTRELGRKLGDFDGKRKGMTQSEGEKAVRYVVDILAAEFILGRNSLSKLLNKSAARKVRKYQKSLEVASKKKK